MYVSSAGQSPKKFSRPEPKPCGWAGACGLVVGPAPCEFGGAVASEGSLGVVVDEKEVLVGESVAGMREAHPDVVLVGEAVPVAPGDVLVDASANASLIVVGSRGRGYFSGLLLGSVSQDVLHRAHCPVAIVR